MLAAGDEPDFELLKIDFYKSFSSRDGCFVPYKWTGHAHKKQLGVPDTAFTQLLNER